MYGKRKIPLKEDCAREREKTVKEMRGFSDTGEG